MLIWPTSLLVQESQGITAALRGHESDLARSAQMVNHEKDLVPREVGGSDVSRLRGRTCGCEASCRSLDLL